MINHDRIFHVNSKMRQNNRASKTNDFRSFFYHICFFAILFSLTRLFFEISAYFLSLFDEFFFIIVKSFACFSSFHKFFMLFCFVNVTFDKLIKNFQFRDSWNFFFRFVHCIFRIRTSSALFFKILLARNLFFRINVYESLVFLFLLRWF